MGLTSGTGRIATIDDPLRCAILISGSGSGMEAMLEHQSRADCFHTTELVISNKSGVLGLREQRNIRFLSLCNRSSEWRKQNTKSP